MPLGILLILQLFLVVSISLSGLIFFDSFSKGFKYNISILDIDFYNLFIQFLISDRSGVLGYGLSLFIFAFVIFEFFPKAVQFIFGIVHFLFLVLWKWLKHGLILLLLCFCMLLLACCVLLNWLAFDCPRQWMVFSCDAIRSGIRAFERFSMAEQHQIKQQYQMEEAYQHYEKSSLWSMGCLVLLCLWLKWLTLFGDSADRYVHQLKKAQASHTAYVKLGEQPLKAVSCIFYSRRKKAICFYLKSWAPLIFR